MLLRAGTYHHRESSERIGPGWPVETADGNYPTRCVENLGSASFWVTCVDSIEEALEKEPTPKGWLVLLEDAGVGERDVVAVTDHNMIEETNTEQLAGLLETLGDRLILGTRRRISGRVVVNHHDRGGVL